MTQEYQGTQLTKIIHLSSEDSPTPEIDNITELEAIVPRPIVRKINHSFVKCIQATGRLYGNPTARSVATSISGDKYHIC